jgi:hypothetical protein
VGTTCKAAQGGRDDGHSCIRSESKDDDFVTSSRFVNGRKTILEAIIDFPPDFHSSLPCAISLATACQSIQHRSYIKSSSQRQTGFTASLTTAPNTASTLLRAFNSSPHQSHPTFVLYSVTGQQPLHFSSITTTALALLREISYHQRITKGSPFDCHHNSTSSNSNIDTAYSLYRKPISSGRHTL